MLFCESSVRRILASYLICKQTLFWAVPRQKTDCCLADVFKSGIPCTCRLHTPVYEPPAESLQTPAVVREQRGRPDDLWAAVRDTCSPGPREAEAGVYQANASLEICCFWWDRSGPGGHTPGSEGHSPVLSLSRVSPLQLCG